MPFSAGDRVTVRGEPWIVEDATAFADATLLNLLSSDSRGGQRRCQLLSPFDRPVPSRHCPRIRAVTRRRWMHHLHGQVAQSHAFGELRAPRLAAMDILPFQLEPALALVRGRASRFLLADEVGLGKTIQAGLMLAELLHRGWCERALIVTPAGLRQQWAEELRRRFRIEATIIDAPSLAMRAGSVPRDVNPWAVSPVSIASIDFVKQPEVLRGIALQSWDVLVVDEAHQATVASLRYDAVSTIAKRARHVLLLTATPHGGDDHAYRALCSIGTVGGDDRVLRFRRTREAIGGARSRRVHLLPVAPTPALIEMHRLLDPYLADLWSIGRNTSRRDVQLVAMVLAKRAFSSARSLATSLARRMAGLTDDGGGPGQAALPLTLNEEPSDAAPLPVERAFDNAGEERTVIQRIVDAAERAQHHERKIEAIKRIVRRVREPLIIFTEYRDTLDAICGELRALREVVTLHGGQTPHERRASLHAFASGAADVLIATDAGSEGLNLQTACRLVVNLELPWNPIRLEQRIGRVDRIGQARTVHAINLLADGTAERTVLANLLRRIDRIRMSDIEIASCVINRSMPAARSIQAETGCTQSVDLAVEARTEAQRLCNARCVGAADSSHHTIPVTVVRSPQTAIVAFFRVRLVTRAGRLIEDALVPVRMPIDHVRGLLRRSHARALAESLTRRFGSELMRYARRQAERRAGALAVEMAHGISLAIARERAIADGLAPRGLPPVQVGLFDNRALKEISAGEERRNRTMRESGARTDLLEAGSNVLLAHDPELALLLILCSRA